MKCPSSLNPNLLARKTLKLSGVKGETLRKEKKRLMGAQTLEARG